MFLPRIVFADLQSCLGHLEDILFFYHLIMDKSKRKEKASLMQLYKY